MSCNFNLDKPSIALIGIGNAGEALLTAIAGQFAVTGYDRDPERMTRLARFAQPKVLLANSAAEAAEGADMVLLSLPTPEVSRSLLAEIAPSLKAGSCVVETSTVCPEDVEAMHNLAAERGARVLDAAIIGGTARLAQGEGLFLVGCPVVEAGHGGQVLQAISAECHFLARRGDGMRAKLAANAAAHAVYVVLLEAAALARAQGVPIDLFQHLMERDTGLMRPLTHRFADRLRSGNFAGGMSVRNARKDSALARNAAQALGVPLFAIAAAHQAYDWAIDAGLDDMDYSAIGLMWERTLGFSFKE